MKNTKQATLGEISLSIVDGPFGSNLKTSDYVPDGIPVLQGQNITNNTFTWSKIRFISPEKAEELARSRVHIGDHILIKIGSIGYSAVIHSLYGYPFAIIPANMAKITPNKELVDSEYLHHWLTSEKAKSYFVRASSKTAQPALSLWKIKAAPIPLPPLAEQRRIAAILDKVDELRTLRQRALARLDDLAQSVFFEMFGDPGSNPRGWETLPAGDIFEIKLGKMRSAKKITGKYLKPYLRNLNVQWGRIDTTSIYEMDFLPSEEERYKLEPGDILVCEGGEVGRTAIFRGEIENCFYQNALHRLRPIKPVIDAEYFVAYMRMASFKGLIAKYTSQVTIAHFTAEKFKVFPVMLPPLNLQMKFSAVMSQVTALREQLDGHLAHLNKLSSAIQHQVFIKS